MDKCDKCGVILIDKRKRKLRSCAHYPIIIEQDNRKCIISFGSNKNRINIKTSNNFNTCFNSLILNKEEL
jgi:hypothetical protein